jgi:hypothetical protein
VLVRALLDVAIAPREDAAIEGVRDHLGPGQATLRLAVPALTHLPGHERDRLPVVGPCVLLGVDHEAVALHVGRVTTGGVSVNVGMTVAG